MESQIILADAKQYLKTVPDNSFDVVFLDPPYRIKNKNKPTDPLNRPEGGNYSGVNEYWETDYEESNSEFILWYVKEAKRICKKDGTVWIMGTYHNIHHVGHHMLEHDYFILNDIVWVKANPVPQFRGVRFNNSIETLIWARPYGKGKYYFDYKAMKEYNGGKQMRSDWNIPLCRGKERITDSEGNILHPTQKPLELLKRVVLSSVPEDGIICDFMVGVGTTAVAAHLYNRKFFVIERDIRYFDAMRTRLNSYLVKFTASVYK